MGSRRDYKFSIGIIRCFPLLFSIISNYFYELIINLFTEPFINLGCLHVGLGYQVDLSFVESISYLSTYSFTKQVYEFNINFNPSTHPLMNQSTCLSITYFVIKFYVISWAVYESNQILNHLFIIYIFYNIFTYVIYYFYFSLFNINILSYLRSTGIALSTHLLIHLSTNLIIPDFTFLSIISH